MKYLILGGGGVCGEYYLPALASLGSADVTVVDPDVRSLATLKAAHPHVRVTAEGYEEVLAALGPSEGGLEEERIVVALPNALHVGAAELALARGRHVLCEKPLSLRAADCLSLADHAKRHQRQLRVAMSRRYLPSMMLAGDLVRSGELGAVTRVEVHDCMPFLWKPRSFSFFDQRSGGILADMGVHYLDFIDTLVGPLSPVSYEDDSRGGAESSLSYELRSGGVAVSMRLSRIAKTGGWIRITCEGGEVYVNKQDEGGALVTPMGRKPRRIEFSAPFEDQAWPSDFHGSFRQMLMDFEGSIRGEQRPRLARGEDASRAAALIEWAYAGRSARATCGATVNSPEVLVTGGTGFIGGHLVDRLASEGRRVRATVRSPLSCANLARYPVEMKAADLLDPASVRQAIAGLKTVYHLAYGREGEDAARITIEGTKNVVAAAVEAGAESVVVLSTMYVYGFPSGGAAVDEGFPYRPYGGEYAQSKAVMERWCLQYARTQSRTRVTILNPTCVFGPAGLAYTTLPVDLARDNRFCWVDEGTGACNYTFVGNLVDAMTAAAANPAAHGERFIINDGTSTWRGLLEPLLGGYAAGVPSYSLEDFKRLPRFGGPFRVSDLVKAMLTSTEVRGVAKRSATIRRAAAGTRKTLGRTGAPVVSVGSNAASAYVEPPPEWLISLFPNTSTRFSSKKAERVLGWKPQIELADAQAHTVSWLQQMGWLPGGVDSGRPLYG